MKKLLTLFCIAFLCNSAFSKDLPPEDIEAAFANSNPQTTISSEISKSVLVPKILSEYSLNTEPSLFREKIFYVSTNKSMPELSQILRSISTIRWTIIHTAAVPECSCRLSPYICVMKR